MTYALLISYQTYKPVFLYNIWKAGQMKSSWGSLLAKLYLQCHWNHNLLHSLHSPCRGQYSSSSMTRAKPKSQILAILFSPIRTFLAARSLWISCLPSRYSIPLATCNQYKTVPQRFETRASRIWNGGGAKTTPKHSVSKMTGWFCFIILQTDQLCFVPDDSRMNVN